LSEIELSRLQAVDPREVWPGEATHFTPWLLSHAGHLAEVLGIDIELERSEHKVGTFSLDLIGRDLSNNAPLIVENQLEQTDHTHLGQLLTYAAGTEASTIVWIATSFREEHRQAVDWLNQNTGEDVHFFAIRLGVVRIGDSLPAPLFETVAQPNEWQKKIRAVTRADGGGPRSDLYQRFWERFLERVRVEHPGWTNASVPPTSSWLTLPSGLRGTHLTPSFATRGRLRHELYIDTGDAQENLDLLTALAERREEIEAIYGRSLEFDELPTRRACKIAEYSVGEVTNVGAHEAYIDWFFDCGERFRRVLDSVEPDRLRR
jgi:hypothetical protein